MPRGRPPFVEREPQRPVAAVRFSVATLLLLKPYAERRKNGVAELARRIVEEALDAKIVDAVLDDGAPR